MKEKDNMFRSKIRILALICALMLVAGLTFAQKKPASKSQLVDINSASAADLAKVPGIDDATAQKIIGGRPYNSKRDLLTRKIVDQAGYDKIQGQIIAHKTGGTAAAKGKKSTGSTTTTPPK
jgi:DNA uptake protein ComE-like DNA-binding protein